MRPRLLSYVPHVLRDVKEFITIMSSEQPEVDLLWECLADAMNDQFIPSATTNGVSRWEKLLGISPKKADTLDERKFRVLLRLNERIPYTYRALQRYLGAISEGYDVYLNANAYALLVTIILSEYVMREDLIQALRRMIPANLTLFMEFLRETPLPPRTLHITPYMGQGHTSTRLPEIEYNADKTHTERVTAVAHSIMATRLPEINELEETI